MNQTSTKQTEWIRHQQSKQNESDINKPTKYKITELLTNTQTNRRCTFLDERESNDRHSSFSLSPWSVSYTFQEFELVDFFLLVSSFLTFFFYYCYYYILVIIVFIIVRIPRSFYFCIVAFMTLRSTLSSSWQNTLEAPVHWKAQSNLLHPQLT